jgi:hypothetical protein
MGCRATPGEKQPQRAWYPNIEHFRDEFGGFIFFNPTTWVKLSCKLIKDQSELDSNVVYQATNPYFATREQGRHHNQVSDRAYENKVLQAFERHIRQMELPFVRASGDRWRVVAADGRQIAEWEGIFVSTDGTDRVIYLEAKHYMDLARLHNFFAKYFPLTRLEQKRIGEIDEKLKRCARALRKSLTQFSIVIAGQHWESDHLVAFVKQTRQYGVLMENGADLSVDADI